MTLLTDFSSRAQTILLSSGWNQERRIGIEEVIVALSSAGIPLNDAAANFLRSFHGLRLDTPLGTLSFAVFNVFEELQYLEKEEREKLEQLLGKTLTPVGHGGGYLLFITPNHEFVFLHDQWFVVLVAKQIVDGIELICSRDFIDYQTFEVTETDSREVYQFGDGL